MLEPKIIVPAAAVAFGLLVWFADPFLLRVVTVLPLFLYGFPALIVAAIFLRDSMRDGRSNEAAWRILLAVAAFAGAVALALPANRFIQERAVAAAKDYPARVAPLLEAYRETHGSYPKSLYELPIKPPVPRLLRKSGAYRSSRASYSFRFNKPGGLIDTWYYYSHSQTWDLST